MNKIKSMLNRYLLKFDLLFRPSRCLSSPLELQLEPTNRCNLNCGVCLRKVKKQEAADMSFEDFQQIIDKFKYLKLVTLHGWGEPLLNPDLFEIIGYARQKGIATAFATGGSLLKPDICLKLVQSHLDKLIFSIDAGESPASDALRKNSYLNEITDNIRYMAGLKKELQTPFPRLGISTTIMKENVRQLDKIIKLAKDLGIPEISFHVAYYPNRYLYEELGVDQRQLKSILDGLTRLGGVLKIKVRYYKLHGGSKPCQTGWFIPFVASNGDVFVCCYQQEPMGNVLTEDFQDIWNNRRYRAFRKQIKTNPNDTCRYCNYLHS